MSKSDRYFWLWLLMVATHVAAAAGESSPLISGSCDRTPGFYADSHYRVGRVIVNSPFDYLNSLRTVTQQATAAKWPQAR